jgi:DtxR family Mn-dependent transcriptional regulator
MSASTAVQDYLKAIYQLGGADADVATSELAVRLGVRAPSVSAMLRRLSAIGLVAHARYQGVRLTPTGLRGALEVIRHHRLLELYLTRVVGLPWDKVHAEAEVLEHVLSEDLESRLDELLGFPTEDPHGDPIPSPDLVLKRTEYRPLSALAAGEQCTVRRVSDRNPELLRHLAELGLEPGASIAVLEVVPFGGGVRFRKGRDVRLVGREAAEAVYVSPRVAS